MKKRYALLAGIFLLGGMLTAINAHAETMQEPETTTPEAIICIEPYYNHQELTDLHMQAGDVLHLEFSGNDSINLNLHDENHNMLFGTGNLESARSYYQNHTLCYDYVAQEEINTISLTWLVYCSSLDTPNAELTEHYTVHTNDTHVTDAVMLKKYLLGTQSITQKDFIYLDRNHDGKVNIYDMIFLKQNLLASRSQTFAPEIRLDQTSAIYAKAWDSALSDTSYIIQSETELDQIIQPLFRDAVVRSLENTYDANFFSKNILLLDFRAQVRSDTYHTLISDVSCKADGIHVLYERLPINGFLEKNSILISQIAIPKENYHDESVIWEEKDEYLKESETPLSYEFRSDLLESYSDVPDAKLITSSEKLTDFFSCLESDTDLISKYQAIYPPEFFESKAVWLKIDSSAGDGYHVWRVTRSGNQIIINQRTDVSSGCVIENFLNQVILNQSDIENASISRRNIDLYGQMFDGYTRNFAIPNEHFLNQQAESLMLNFYSFRDQSQLDCYGGYYIGVNGYDYQKLFSYPCDQNPFAGEYQEIKEDDTIIYQFENASIIWNPDKISFISHDTAIAEIVAEP